MNVSLKEHKQCPKHVLLKKIENKSVIVLHVLGTGNMIHSEGVKILQKYFNTHKERLTTEALNIWVNKDSLNRKDGIQLASNWQIFVNN